ncbi:hypothetical protein GCM10022243_22610 [Saccharothrix violaceirubra]|uniref:Beta-lactamase class A n=1 Tax=Saccharothrix violaceirubra TaxID=413306 RepID=A0A7W7WVR6_9PSEU|nr:serine hydrolase [Saccharothrix violaceirubra]MBB4964803.1 beta-lactamase class A [Saccharothrix violaceirubra]
MTRLSVHVARRGAAPTAAVRDDEQHDAASTVKIAVLGALRGHDPDTPVPVVAEFPSGAGDRFSCDQAADSDPAVWARIGATAPLGWLADRMITHSSNLATNLCALHVGLPAVAGFWHAAATGSTGLARLIDDNAARRTGVHNTVTAADLVRVLWTLTDGELDVLARNVHRVDLAAGLPPGTRIAFKNGWDPGVRHSVGLVWPADAPPYAIAVCYTGPLADGRTAGDPAADVLARISHRMWQRRREPAAPLTAKT